LLNLNSNFQFICQKEDLSKNKRKNPAVPNKFRKFWMKPEKYFLEMVSSTLGVIF
jgi:hypothetical protein